MIFCRLDSLKQIILCSGRVSLLVGPRLQITNLYLLLCVAIVDRDGKFAFKINIANLLIGEHGRLTGLGVLSLHLNLVSHGGLLNVVLGSEWAKREVGTGARQLTVERVESVRVLYGLAGFLTQCLLIERALEAATERVVKALHLVGER